MSVDEQLSLENRSMTRGGMMSDYPLRGEGIEIRENTHKSDPDRLKYNIHVDEDLFLLLSDPRVEWGLNKDTGRRVLGYTATDEGYNPARSDDKCPSG